MSHTETGIDALEGTIKKTNEWIKDIETALGWEDRHFAYLALRTVLHALRDRLPLAPASHLGDQLPLLIRGIYYENWSPTRHHELARTPEDFLALLEEAFPKEDDLDALGMARAVFEVLGNHVSEGEMRIVRACLPGSWSVFWD